MGLFPYCKSSKKIKWDSLSTLAGSSAPFLFAVSCVGFLSGLSSWIVNPLRAECLDESRGGCFGLKNTFKMVVNWINPQSLILNLVVEGCWFFAVWLYTLSIESFCSGQFSSVTESCLTVCNPMDYSTPGFPVHHQLPETTQTPVSWVGDAIQPSHPLSSPSPAFNLSQHQGLFQWVNSSHQVAIVFEFKLQHQSFPWIFRTDFL